MDWGFVAWLALGLMAAQIIAFAVLYAVRSAWQVSPTSRALLAFLVVAAVAFCGFWAFPVAPIPGWIFAAVFTTGNLVMARLLVLLVRAQRQDRESIEERQGQ